MTCCIHSKTSIKWPYWQVFGGLLFFTTSAEGHGQGDNVQGAAVGTLYLFVLLVMSSIEIGRKSKSSKGTSAALAILHV